MSPPTTRRQLSRNTLGVPPTTCHQSSRNTLGVPPTSPPPIVVRDVRETTLWRRGKPLKKKQYPGQGKVDDRKQPPKSKVDDRKHPPGGGGGGGGDRGVGGVCGGDDVRGDERTTNDVGAAAAASSTAIDLLDDDPDLCLTPPNTGVAGTKDVGAAAAASSTAAYRDKYGDDGSGADGFGSDNDDVIDLLDDHDPDLYLTPPNTDIDDDDYVDIDSDSEDEARTSFPKNKKLSKNLIIGGPQPTDTTGMSAVDAKLTKEANQTLRKQWSDKIRLQRLKENKVGSPPCASLGNINENLRVMVDVEANRLSVGHMFPIKQIFWLRIAEEALLRGINVRSVRSDYTNLIVTGPSFYVSGRF